MNYIETDGLRIQVGDDGVNFFSITKDRPDLLPIAKAVVEKATCYVVQDSTYAVNFFYADFRFTIGDRGNFRKE